MIEDGDDLRHYLRDDLGRSRWPAAARLLLGSPIHRFVLLLRLSEYTLNCWHARPGRWAAAALWRVTVGRGIRLGFTIPRNVCGPGLSLAHWGSVVISARSRIGARCRIHSGVNVGEQDGVAPVIGNGCYLGPGAKVFGDVTLGDRCRVGANAVVTRSFGPGPVVGIPARPVSPRAPN